MEYRKRDYRCWNKSGEEKCVNLYTCRLEDKQITIINMDNKGLIHIHIEGGKCKRRKKGGNSERENKV